MKRRHKRKPSSEVNLGFQIAPMIDVVFVIMLYFMVMAGAVQVENAHNTKLPGTTITESETPMPEEIAVRIEEDNQVYLNDEPFDDEKSRNLPELANNLNQLRQNADDSKSKALVTIYASEQANYQRIVDVLDALSRANIGDVTFQAGAPE